MPSQNSKKSAVICIGNDLIGDDAVGWKIYQRLLDSNLQDESELHYLSVGGIALLDIFKTGLERIIVVDAVQFGAPVGTVHVISWDELPPKNPSAISVHQVGIEEAVMIARVLFPEKCPQNIMLVGIEGRRFSQLGEEMSKQVEQSIGKALCFIDEHLHHH